MNRSATWPQAISRSRPIASVSGPLSTRRSGGVDLLPFEPPQFRRLVDPIQSPAVLVQSFRKSLDHHRQLALQPIDPCSNQGELRLDAPFGRIELVGLPPRPVVHRSADPLVGVGHTLPSAR